MKINAIITSDIIKKDGIFKDRILLINSLVITFGIITGTLFYTISEDYLAGEIWESFVKFNIDFTAKTKTEVLSGLIMGHLPYVFMMILFGTSAVGIYFIAPLAFIKSSGLGLIVAYLYSSFGLKGVEYALIIFLPGKFFVILSMLLLMHTSINYSAHIRGLIRGDSVKENSSTLYMFKVLTAVLMFILSAFVECFLIISFSSLFSF